MAISLKVKGLDEVIKKFDELAVNTKEDVTVALNVFGKNVVRDAKQLVSINSSDEGGLLRGIDSSIGSLSVTITSMQNYSAYIEFGTRKFAASYVSSLPADWQTFAATFKGRGEGDFYDFLFSILDWVKRKGLVNRYSVKTRKRIALAKKDDPNLERVAWLIAMKILRNGIRPRPFLYPSIKKNIPVLEKYIETIFK